jgi:concanavalin A-like lectin/glucanase superfamily protein/FecR-like protein
MKLKFPSREFDDTVAVVCHGPASDEQGSALNELLRSDAAARDEYILRLELHSRLASEPDLFTSIKPDSSPLIGADRITPIQKGLPLQNATHARNRRRIWAVPLAACFVLLAAGLWSLRLSRPTDRTATGSKAVAMLNRTVNAQWNVPGDAPRLNAPLEPGWFELESGLAEVVFYSGARFVIEGPAELQLISASHASCRRGRITAEVPPPARGFRIDTPQGTVTDLGTSFGLDVKDRRTELHVFKGSVKLQAAAEAAAHNLREGSGAVLESSRAPRLIAADRTVFLSLFDLQAKSVAAEALRFDRWQAASERLNGDPSLLVRFDLEGTNSFHWQLRNACKRRAAMTDATIVGCQWVEGRWPNKRALEFQSVNDRVRVSVPGRFESLTLTAWVRVQGLDRKLNSLFMSDGFVSGTVHWLIRRDGVLGLTVIGADSKNHQIAASPPVLTLDKFGMWLHLAVVLDGSAKRVVHYVNGQPVSGHALRIDGPFHIGDAELGNWNGKGFPSDDPFMIRNFSGAMDEFCLFSRALNSEEIQTLYAQGKPQGDTPTVH